MATPGYKARVRLSGAPVAVLQEPAGVVETGAGYTVIRITDAARRVLDSSASVVVLRTSTTDAVIDQDVSAALTETDRLSGTFRLGAAYAADSTFEVSTSYLPLSTVAQATAASLDLSCSSRDESSFDSDWAQRGYGLLSATGSLSRWQSDFLFRDALLARQEVVIEFTVDKVADAGVMVVRAILAKDALSSAVDGNVETQIEFESTVDVDGRAISLR